MNDVVVGIDIGSSKVCTIAGQMNRNNQMQVLGVGSTECKGIKKGIIVDIDSAVEAVKSSVQQAERMSNNKIDSAYINIGGGHASLIKNKGVIAIAGENREISSRDVERVLQASKVLDIPVENEIIGIIPIQFIVDGYEHIKDPVGMIGVRLEVDAYIITAPSASVQNLARCVQKSGIEVQGIILDPLAASEVVLTRDDKDLGVAIVDVGGEVTDISIFKGDNLIFTKMIPVGGSHITNDISIGLKIPFSEAELLKRQYGYASVSMLKSEERIPLNSIGNNKGTITNKELVDIIEARVQEIYFLVNQELALSGYKDSLSRGVVLTGGGLSFIKGTIETAVSIIGLPVRVAAPSYIGVASPIYTTATGMVKDILSSRKATAMQKVPVLEDDYEEDKESGSSKFITKIKNFLSDFF